MRPAVTVNIRTYIRILYKRLAFKISSFVFDRGSNVLSIGKPEAENKIPIIFHVYSFTEIDVTFLPYLVNAFIVKFDCESA